MNKVGRIQVNIIQLKERKTKQQQPYLDIGTFVREQSEHPGPGLTLAELGISGLETMCSLSTHVQLHCRGCYFRGSGNELP